jgi:Tfp pilus assembly protein PilV
MGKNDHTQRWHGQGGMSLVESLIGLVVLTIVLVAAAQLFRVQVMHLSLSERARQADTQANNVMNSLAAYNQSALPDTNPFSGKSPTQTIADGDQLSLDTSVCQAVFACDKIVRAPQASGSGVDYTVLSWTQTLPTGSSLAYYRGWRVTTIDAAKHVRQLTVAIMPADLNNQPGDAIEPLALRQSTVVQRQ